VLPVEPSVQATKPKALGNATWSVGEARERHARPSSREAASSNPEPYSRARRTPATTARSSSSSTMKPGARLAAKGQRTVTTASRAPALPKIEDARRASDGVTAALPRPKGTGQGGAPAAKRGRTTLTRDAGRGSGLRATPSRQPRPAGERLRAADRGCPAHGEAGCQARESSAC
jgi:hypothetical protein